MNATFIVSSNSISALELSRMYKPNALTILIFPIL